MATSWKKWDKTTLDRNSCFQLPLPSFGVGDDLGILVEDRKIKTNHPKENKNRRTILVIKENNTYGFTLQSYGLHRRQLEVTELYTYVDYVELGGPAHKAGMRAGDVILSINGESVEYADHATLVNYVKSCSDSLRMVVLFEDACRKIDLHLRYIKLQQVLSDKISELHVINSQEKQILEKVGAFGGSDRISYNLPTDSSSSVSNSFFDAESIFPIPCSTSTPQFSSSYLSSPETNPSSSFNNSNSLRRAVDSVSGLQDDVFWNSIPEYGSLPSAVRRKSRKVCCGFESPALCARNASHFLESSIFEERDESQDNLPLVVDCVEIKARSLAPKYENVNVPNTAPITMIGSGTPSNELSRSVPNLMKLRSTSSPNVGKNSLVRSLSRQQFLRHETNDNIIVDHRSKSRQVQQHIANFVATDDVCRRSNDPQLLSLKKLCNDFRDSCLQQNLVKRKKSIDLMISSELNSIGFTSQSSSDSSSRRLSKGSLRIVGITSPENCDGTNLMMYPSYGSCLKTTKSNLIYDVSIIEFDDDGLYINTKDEMTRL